MIKLYLAAYRQTENHGPGKKIALTTSKPDELKVDGAFQPFIPPPELIQSYLDLQLEDQNKASEFFVSAFKKQIKNFLFQAQEDAKKNNISILELLPFKDGDTLLTWERYGNRSIRPLLAELLEEVGYEIVLR